VSGGRREDHRLVTGRGRFVADFKLPGTLDAAFVRSDVAHGVLRAVRLDVARRVDGVLGAWSAADLPDLPVVPPPPNLRTARPWPALATDRVRYAGEPVAIVVGRDRYAAEDGRDAAQVEIEPLPVLLDPTESADSDVHLFSGLSNVAAEQEFGRPASAGTREAAIVVVEAVYRQNLVAHTSMEARAILVRPEAGGGLTVWCSHQAPHRLRDDLSEALGLARDAVRVIVPDAGGAFGGKSATFAEYLAVADVARRLERPVRWLEDRAEALLAGPRGRGQNQRVRLHANPDGRIRALELELDADVGGYPHTGSFMPFASGMMGTGAYAIPEVYVRARAVLTTTAPTAPYRGAGRPEAAYCIERTVDALARRLELDPAEVRRRNHIPPQAFPYRSPTGFTYDSGDYTRAMDVALKAIDYDGWRAEQARGDRRLGIGICTYVERSGALGEYAAVEACPDGTYLALSGCCSTGQGHETAFPQVVASVLEVDPVLVTLVEADTAVVPRGVGSFASRSMQTGGAALHRSARRLIDEAVARVAKQLDVPASAVEYRAGRVSCGDRSISLAELAPLRAEDVFDPPQAFPFGAYVAVVEVDPSLGTVKILRLVAVDDYGVVVNPMIVDGQTAGSVTQGLGQALYEQAGYDAQGRPTALSLLDYLLPTASEIPPWTFAETVTANPNTPLGAKGAGEAGCIGVPPAVANAIADALSRDDIGDLPFTPEVVWRAFR
jgi:aerobic carbon-monoxide dehydrogenase large subunit